MAHKQWQFASTSCRGGFASQLTHISIMPQSSQMKCPHCGSRIPDKLIKSEAGRLSAKKRSISHAGGRPKKLSKCPKCGFEGGTVELRKPCPHRN